MSEALYRKYRPQTFADVVGQDHIERTIRNAIEQDKVSHAYLFCGPRGTGKTTTARLLAKALLCEGGPTPDPDGTCRDCREIAAGAHPDVYELDAASRTGVENVREEIIGRVQFAPTRGRKKVYIIDEVHMLSTAAFNALLKTLEEPPSHVVFILCTTDPQKVPETIHSRCQRFDFRRIGSESIVSRLGAICVSEGVEFEGEALDLIAHRAEGGMRNALTALEQAIAFGEGKVTLRATEDMLGSLNADDMAEIVNAIGVRDVAACFAWTARYIETGADLAQFARDLASHFRNMYVLSLAGADVALDVSEAERCELAEELGNYGPDRLTRLLAVLGDVLAELRTSTNPRLTFEIALTRMVRPDSDLTLASLAERVEALEAGRSAVAYGSVGAVAGTAVAGVPATPPAVRAEGPATSGASAVAPRPAAAGDGAPSLAPQAPALSSPPAQAAAAPGTAGAFAAGSAAPPSSAPAPAAPSPRAEGAPGAASRSQDPAPAARSESAPAPAPAVSPVAPAARSVASIASPESAAAMPAVRPAATAADGGDGGASSVSDAAPGRGASSGRSSRYGATDPAMASTLRNPAALQRLWQAAMSDLKRTKPAYNVMFINTRIVCDGAGEGILVSFPAANSFAYSAVQRPDVVESVSAALERAAGMPVAFRVEQDSAAVGRGASPAQPASAGAPSGFAPPVAAPPSAPAVRAAAPMPQPPSAPAVAAPSSAAVPASPAAAPGAGQAGTAPRPAAGAQPVQPVMPRLRRSASTLGGSSRAAAGPDEGVPGLVAADDGVGPDARRDEGAIEGIAADMPRPAPKRKKPLPVPGKGVKPPTYVREGIREEPAGEGPEASAREEEGASGLPPAVEAAPAVDDDYDQVPLDAYEGMPCPEDDVPPWEDAPAAAPAPPAAASASAPASSPAPTTASPAPASAPAAAPAPVAEASAPPTSSSSAPAPAAPASAAMPDGSEPSADELNAFLSAGFGEGVVFQEVRE